MTASAPSAAAAAVVILTLTLTLVSDVSGFPSRHLDPSAVDDTRLGKEMNTLSERLNRLATQLQAQLAETTDLQLLLGKDSVWVPHSQHRFPARFSEICQICLRH